MAMCCSALLGDAVPPLQQPLVPATHAVSSINAVLDTAAPYWHCLTPYRVSLPASEDTKRQRRAGASETKTSIDSNQVFTSESSYSTSSVTSSLSDKSSENLSDHLSNISISE